MNVATAASATTKSAAPYRTPLKAIFERFDVARRCRELAKEARERAAKYRAEHERCQREIADLKEARQILVDALEKVGRLENDGALENDALEVAERGL